MTAGDKIAGVRFTKAANSGNVRVREIIVDGQLDQDTEGCAYNVVVLDVTDPNDFVPVGQMKAYTFPNNRRTFIPVPPDAVDPNDFLLPNVAQSRTYEVRVRVTEYRMNPLTDLSVLNTPLGITVSGGLNPINSAGEDICEEPMSLQSIIIDPTYTSPVKVRLSRKHP